MPVWLLIELAPFVHGRNLQDVSFFLIVVVVAVLRSWRALLPDEPAPDPWASIHVLTALPIDLYAVLLVLNYYRILRYLSYYKSVGVLTIVVNFMLVDVAVFATLLFLITIGFGLAFTTLNPAQASESNFALVGGAHPFWSAFWGMFGDYDRGSIYEQQPSIRGQ